MTYDHFSNPKDRAFSLREEEAIKKLLETPEVAVMERERLTDIILDADEPVDQGPTLEEVHAEFDAAHERILRQANQILEKAEDVDEVTMSQLSDFGFGNAKNVKRDLGTVKKVKGANAAASAVRYYFSRYPFQKFITESEIMRISRKYGLVFAQSERLIGAIPEENQADIVNFKLKWIDQKLLNIKGEAGPTWMIAATPDQVRLEANEKIEGNRIVKEAPRPIRHPDPIVFHRVWKGFLIITKWGPEAEIEEFH